jgi:hypothetical protein
MQRITKIMAFGSNDQGGEVVDFERLSRRTAAFFV